MIGEKGRSIQAFVVVQRHLSQEENVVYVNLCEGRLSVGMWQKVGDMSECRARMPHVAQRLKDNTARMGKFGSKDDWTLCRRECTVEILCRR